MGILDVCVLGGKILGVGGAWRGVCVWDSWCGILGLWAVVRDSRCVELGGGIQNMDGDAVHCPDCLMWLSGGMVARIFVLPG